jgi:excisionase family DNA binding protein
MPDRLLTPDEVAGRLRISRQRLYAWRHKGIGPRALQLEGRLLRYRESDLAAWENRQADHGRSTPR